MIEYSEIISNHQYLEVVITSVGHIWSSYPSSYNHTLFYPRVFRTDLVSARYFIETLRRTEKRVSFRAAVSKLYLFVSRSA